MRNRILILLFLCGCNLFLYSQIYVYSGGEVVGMYSAEDVDSITFREPCAVDSVGALPCRFSVSADRQVVFSKGNLQYHAADDRWRFANNQYDIIGEGNSFIAEDYEGWIDLFGWGTSGFEGNKPTNTSQNSDDYIVGKVNISGTNYDWGFFNAIQGGGDEAGVWRTLTFDECVYLFTKRENASNLIGVACVAGVNGVVVLPDDWVEPKGGHFRNEFSYNVGDDFANINNYSSVEWAVMEYAGALFLPAAGVRNGMKVILVGEYGYYWLTDYDSLGMASCFLFEIEGYLTKGSAKRYLGLSVRLVKDVEK